MTFWSLVLLLVGIMFLLAIYYDKRIAKKRREGDYRDAAANRDRAETYVAEAVDRHRQMFNDGSGFGGGES
jgi:hypothetical protein